jgi:uncharacterized membrane protein YhiD involved in acid resistance
MIKSLFANWKTTSAGLTMIVGAAVHMGYAIHAHGLTEADCTGSLIAIIGGIGFIAAGDANVNPPTQPKEN